MKLYVIKDIENIPIAISENKEDIYGFYLQNNLSDKDYHIISISDKNTINNILIIYDMNYIIDFRGYYIREIDYNPIKNYIYEYVEDLHTTINTLNSISEYLVGLNDSKLNDINKVSKYIRKSIYKKLNINKIIKDYYTYINLRNNNIFINMRI